MSGAHGWYCYYLAEDVEGSGWKKGARGPEILLCYSARGGLHGGLQGIGSNATGPGGREQDGALWELAGTGSTRSLKRCSHRRPYEGSRAATVARDWSRHGSRQGGCETRQHECKQSAAGRAEGC